MRYACVVLLFVSAFVACAVASNELWGELSSNDVLLAKETITKSHIMGLVVTDKYSFKQKDKKKALTITAIKITDKKSSNGGKARISKGGPGSKSAIIKFKSQRSHGINSVVEIYGH